MSKCIRFPLVIEEKKLQCDPEPKVRHHHCSEQPECPAQHRQQQAGNVEVEWPWVQVQNERSNRYYEDRHA